MHEWPLMVFTLMAQASIGGLLLTLLLCVPRFASWTEPQRDEILRLPLLAFFAVGAIGVLASILHLGNPWHMFYTITHVSTSWMSREIVSVCVYMGLLGLCVACVCLEWSLVAKRFAVLAKLVRWKRALFRPLLLVTGLVGFGTVFVMSECYTDKIFVMWSRPLVYASYWGATLLVGGALACATLLITLRKYDKDQTSVGRMIQTAFFAGCAGLLLFAASVLALPPRMDAPVTNAITPRQVNFDTLFQLGLLRGALLAAGLFVIYRMVRRPPAAALTLRPLLAAIVIFAGEFIGRYVFFSLGLSAVH